MFAVLDQTLKRRLSQCFGRSAARSAYSGFRFRRSYTIGMKTAVSLPDRVYREAEGYAKRTRKSRSQLYAEALAEYLVRHAPDEVTEAMNLVVDELGDVVPDSFVERAGRRMLRNVEW